MLDNRWASVVDGQGGAPTLSTRMALTGFLLYNSKSLHVDAYNNYTIYVFGTCRITIQ